MANRVKFQNTAISERIAEEAKKNGILTASALTGFLNSKSVHKRVQELLGKRIEFEATLGGVRNHLQNRTIPNALYSIFYAAAFGCSVDYLYFGTEPEIPKLQDLLSMVRAAAEKEGHPVPAFDEYEQELMSIVTGLSVEDKQIILKMARRMSERIPGSNPGAEGFGNA